MKPGDLVRIKLDEFESTDHPYYDVPGIALGISESTIQNIPEEYRLWEILLGGEIARVQGLDLEVITGSER
jgi:hypothetical protein